MENKDEDNIDKNWPKGVQPITIGQMGFLGVSDDNKIYWNGKPIKTENKISLNFWQTIGTALVVLSTVVIAVFEVLDFFYKL